MKFHGSTILVATAAVLALANPAAAKSRACDRACLGQVLDAYMGAVFKHDPKAAPLGAGYRATENLRAVAPGEGVWKSVSGLGQLQRRYFDPVNGQAGYYGTLLEGAETDVAILRIKVVGRKVTEAEWIMARKEIEGATARSGGLNRIDLEGALAFTPRANSPLPAGVRSSRKAMIDAVHVYFQGLRDGDGSKTPHLDGCERIENGVKVTHRVRANGSLSGDCVDGFKGLQSVISGLVFERVPLIDEVEGMVFGEVLATAPAGVDIKDVLITEFFGIENGKVTGIWASNVFRPDDAPRDGGWK